jgi:hypothetical protein
LAGAMTRVPLYYLRENSIIAGILAQGGVLYYFRENSIILAISITWQLQRK